MKMINLSQKIMPTKKTADLISAGVPPDLGGGGASIRELCDVLKIIGGACGSTGLALSMHTHKSLFGRGVGTTKKLLAI